MVPPCGESRWEDPNTSAPTESKTRTRIRDCPLLPPPHRQLLHPHHGPLVGGASWLHAPGPTAPSSPALVQPVTVTSLTQGGPSSQSRPWLRAYSGSSPALPRPSPRSPEQAPVITADRKRGKRGREPLGNAPQPRGECGPGIKPTLFTTVG